MTPFVKKSRETISLILKSLHLLWIMGNVVKCSSPIGRQRIGIVAISESAEVPHLVSSHLLYLDPEQGVSEEMIDDEMVVSPGEQDLVALDSRRLVNMCPLILMQSMNDLPLQRGISQQR